MRMLMMFLAAIIGASGSAAQITLPTGQRLTPLAAPGAKFQPLVTRTGPDPSTIADGAAAAVTSPDRSEMLMMTSGYNRFNGTDGKIVDAQSVQYIFRYAITRVGSRLLHTLTVPNSFGGIAWLHDGRGFVVGGGVDDNVHLFSRGPGGFAELGKPIALGHAAGNGADIKPQAAGIAVSPAGSRAIVANYYNDSVSLLDLERKVVLAELDLRPGKIDAAESGVPGGEYPLGIIWTDANQAWVSAPRDRQLVQLAVSNTGMKVAARVATLGEPTALLADGAKRRLYATQDNADRLAVVDLATGRLLSQPRLGLSEAMPTAASRKGTNPNALALLPDHRLLVTLGGINAVAVVAPERDGKNAAVQGLVPTGWYPSAVAVSRDGSRVFVANRKSPPGPNPQGCAPALAIYRGQPSACGSANQYIFQLEKAGLLQFPMPSPTALVGTTMQVAQNIGLGVGKARVDAEAKMALVRAHIKHVIFIVKENRTYDQVLGDLEVGNGDPHLAILGARFSPNHHQLARQFVTLDNFYDSGEQSSTGWTWTTAGRTTDLLEKTAPVNYARRGLAYDSEEADRFIYTQQSPAERHATNPKLSLDPDLLPGSALATAPDGPGDDEDNQGYLWDAAIKAGLSVRNYGFSDASIYDAGTPGAVPLVREPAKTGTRIYTPGDKLLASRSDPFFRGFDQKMPDYWRVLEWQREFDAADAAGKVPALTLLRLSHDHFGDFKQAIDGVDTVETQMADNDYAVGLVVERIANSRVRGATLIFIIEDDAQNGADHVDARRSVAFVVGPTVKQKTLISTHYTTVSLLRTIEVVLGLRPLGLNDSLAMPMAELFDPTSSDWNYRARAADVLRSTKLPIPADRFTPSVASADCGVRDAQWWAAAMDGEDFRSEDHLDSIRFNTALWEGLGSGPEPTSRSGSNLRANRRSLVTAARAYRPCD